MNSRIYFGNQASQPGTEKTVFENRTLNSSEASSKSLTLQQTPISQNEVSAWVVGGSVLVGGTDFTITGNVLDFSISQYAPLLNTGDKLFILYNKA